MVIQRGEIWWANLDDPRGSGPGYRRPILIVQSDPFNRSSIRTVVAAIITKNLELAKAPGNVSITARASGLPVDSVVNVSQLVTFDRDLLLEYVSTVSAKKMAGVANGIRLVLDL